jgi:hypothetical protein
MRDLALISPLNAQNPIVSNIKMSHRVIVSVVELGIGDVL